MNQPSVRFPLKDINNCNWEKIKIGDLGTFIRGQTFQRDDVTGIESDVLIVRSSNLIDGWYVDISDDVQYVSIDVPDQERLKKNDVVICTANGSTSLVGKASIYDGSYNGSISWGAFCSVFRPKVELAKYLFNTYYYKKIITIHKQGGNGALANLNVKNISSEEIVFPVSKEEQEKIAQFFSLIDRKICTAQVVIDKFENIRKTISEKIYDGEISLKKVDGKPFPKWQTKRLDKLLKFQNGINASKEKFGSGIKLISVREVLLDEPIRYDLIESSISVNEKEAERFSVEYGDILFQRSSETAEEAGSTNVYLDARPAVFGGFVIRGKKKSDYHPQFLKMALRSSKVRRQIMRLAQGAQHINIGQEQLSSIEVRIPCIEEQEKIAELISTLEEKQRINIEKLGALKSLKQAFMQRMFL